MACYSPLTPYKKRGGGITFQKSESLNAEKTTIPCGQCLGCRLEHSRQWAIRCVHEASLYDANSFITLTYNDQNYPPFGSLNKKTFQDFMKRLRKKLHPLKIRYYHCGEYGAKLSRPHYHAIIFNYDFPDKKFLKKINGVPLYTSQLLSEIWGFGFVTVGDVTFESAAYVARYVLKKINGEQKEQHYKTIDAETGEVNNLQQEYVTMSRKPGIAREWYNRFKDDVFPSDEVILINKNKAKKLHPPSFYTKIYQHENPEEYEKLKNKRAEGLKKHKKNNTKERLAVREKIHELKVRQLKRHEQEFEQ